MILIHLYYAPDSFIERGSFFRQNIDKANFEVSDFLIAAGSG